MSDWLGLLYICCELPRGTSFSCVLSFALQYKLGILSHTCITCYHTSNEPPLPPLHVPASSSATRNSFSSCAARLASSRALERPLNHRSTTRIREDMSTAIIRPIPSLSTIGPDDDPQSSQPSLADPAHAHARAALIRTFTHAGPIARTTAV